MPQFADSDDFHSVDHNHPHAEFCLLLIAQNKQLDEWWPIGSAVLIGNGIAVSARHILHFVQRRILNIHLDSLDAAFYGPDVYYRMPEGDHIGFDAIQFTNDSPNGFFRWSVHAISAEPRQSVDLVMLDLRPHPLSPPKAVSAFGPLELQIFPPAVGQEILVVGWPDHPSTNGGPLPNKVLSDTYLYESKGSVTQICEVGGDREGFLSDARTESGMSGGAILARKPNDELVVAGVVSRKLDDLSTHTALWTLLPQKAPDHEKGTYVPIPILADRGILNLPGKNLFTFGQIEGKVGLHQVCTIPEITGCGTYQGKSVWTFLECPS